MTDPKEPNFFSDEKNWARGTAWYEALFSTMPTQDLKGESSTHYTKLPTYPDCAQRVHDALPDAKLIYVMRDPVERIVSQYIHEWSMHTIVDGCSIDEAIHRYPILIEYSKYAYQLEPYIERFGSRSILPVFFERMTAMPQDELKRVVKHIGHAGAFTWEDTAAKNVSSQRQRRSPVLNSVLENRFIQVVRRTLMPESLRAKIRSRWAMKERPELSPESLRYLYAQLDPDLQQLGQMLGIELSCAGFKEQVIAGAAPELARSSDE